MEEATERDVMMVAGDRWMLQAPGEIWGRHLRYLLSTLLAEANEPLTVAELVARCEREGVVFSSRASKVVSDALRWEINWGRVVRLSRGVYRASRMPRSTKRWIARRVGDIRVYLGSLRRQVAEAQVLSRSLLPRPPIPGDGFVT